LLVLSFAVVLGLIITSVPSNTKAATNTVKLVHAHTYAASYYIFLSGTIEVDNLAYNKQVSVVYSSDGLNWYEKAASYLKATSGNREAWTFNFAVGSNTAFAIKYVVNGQTYWDNNNGNNYSISGVNSFSSQTLTSPTVAIGNPPVKLNNGLYFSNSISNYNNIHIDATTNNFVGSVIVKNLAYEKQVKIRYSTDDWATYQEANAVYNSAVDRSNGDLEAWTFSIPVGSAQVVKYISSYTVNGITYWDNNLEGNASYYEANRY
jgi:hypothetical protein